MWNRANYPLDGAFYGYLESPMFLVTKFHTTVGCWYVQVLTLHKKILWTAHTHMHTHTHTHTHMHTLTHTHAHTHAHTHTHTHPPHTTSKKRDNEYKPHKRLPQQTLARMAYLENYTSVLLGVFFIVTGVKNWIEHINVRILGLQTVPLRTGEQFTV